MVRSVVVLPTELGPNSTKKRPSATLKDRLSSARTRPYDLHTFVKRSAEFGGVLPQIIGEAGQRRHVPPDVLVAFDLVDDALNLAAQPRQGFPVHLADTFGLGDSLVTLERLVGFFNQGVLLRQSPKDIREGIRTTTLDIRALSDHANFLSQKITFLLDATLGMVNIEQNAIIKIFSVAAVVFPPPTLVASIYGMNFAHMPELDWRFAYPLALVLMLVSAILPYLFFKKRGWL